MQSDQRCVADASIHPMVACNAHDTSITFTKFSHRQCVSQIQAGHHAAQPSPPGRSESLLPGYWGAELEFVANRIVLPNESPTGRPCCAAARISSITLQEIIITVRLLRLFRAHRVGCSPNHLP